MGGRRYIVLQSKTPAKELRENGTGLLQEGSVYTLYRSSQGSNSNTTHIGIPLKIHNPTLVLMRVIPCVVPINQNVAKM